MAWEKEPEKIKFEAGEKVFFCACGKSKKGALCDGSHKGTGIKPEIRTFEAEKELLVCRCGQSNLFPFCDGGHQTLQ